jgi:putative addiction module killer protein
VIEVIQYIDSNGRIPFERWLKNLDSDTKLRISFSISRLESGSIPAKSVGQGVLELRLNFGPGHRVYFGRDGEELVILLVGGTKKRRDADIETAQLLWREYKNRKGKP